VRIDHNFTMGHKIFARFSWKEQTTVSHTAHEASGLRTRTNPTRNLVVSDDWPASSALLNEFRFGFTSSDIG